jgi:HSP90 family molecular chaperone
MEKINRAQAFANQEKASSYMLAKKTLELNPHHPVIKELLAKVKASQGGQVSDEVVEYADLLYNMALLNSGFLIENPTDLTTPL